MLFQEMIDGKYKDGEKVLRAKIDMASPNINMRDSHTASPKRLHQHGRQVLRLSHVRLRPSPEDAFEEITHSLCTLEFEDHSLFTTGFRELDWRCLPSRSNLRV